MLSLRDHLGGGPVETLWGEAGYLVFRIALLEGLTYW